MFSTCLVSFLQILWFIPQSRNVFLDQMETLNCPQVCAVMDWRQSSPKRGKMMSGNSCWRPLLSASAVTWQQFMRQAASRFECQIWNVNATSEDVNVRPRFCLSVCEYLHLAHRGAASLTPLSVCPTGVSRFPSMCLPGREQRAREHEQHCVQTGQQSATARQIQRWIKLYQTTEMSFYVTWVWLHCFSEVLAATGWEFEGITRCPSSVFSCWWSGWFICSSAPELCLCLLINPSVS